MGLGSFIALAVGGMTLFALKDAKQQADVAARRGDGPEARPPEPAPSPAAEAVSPVAEVVPRPTEASVPPKAEATPADPGRPDEPKKVEPVEAPEAKRRRLSLEEEWRAYSRMNGAETQTIDRNLHITDLTVSGGEASDADLAELTHLPHVRRLTLRDVDSNKVTDAGFAHIAGLPNLEHLQVAGLDVTDAACAHVGKLTSLKLLDLSGTRVSDDGMKALAGLTKLERLGLAGTTVGAEGLSHLLGAKGLTALDVRGTRVRADELKVIGRFTALTVLRLPGVERPRELPADPVYAELSDGNSYAPSFELEPADGFKPLPPHSVDYVAGLKHLAGLVHLESVEMTRAFRAANPDRRGKRVNFIKHLAWDESPLSEFDTYRKAYTTDGKLDVTKGHAGYLGRMQRAPDGSLAWKREGHAVGPSVSIASADLYQFLMRPNGALLEHIRDWDNVTSLDLSGFMVVDEDLKFLAKHARLERLDLSGSPITAKGLAHLTGLPKLRYLNLRGAAVGDKDIAALRKMKGLRDVVLSQSNVTAAGAEAFRKGAVRAVFDPEQKRPWWCDVDWRAELEKHVR